MRVGRRRLSRLLKPVALGLVAGACLIAGIAVLAARAVPSWWPVLDPSSPAIQAAGELLESTVVEASHRVRPLSGPDATWTLTLDENDLNAWLATRLPKWLSGWTDAHADTDAPPWFRAARVRFDDGLITVGVCLAESPDTRESYFDVALEPSINSAGDLLLTPRGVHAGRMPLPTRIVLDQLRARLPKGEADPPAASLLNRLSVGEPAVLPIIRLADRRRVIVRKAVVADRVLTLTCSTVGEK